jgi:hypothetical protein
MARRFNQLRSSKYIRAEVDDLNNALLYQFFDFKSAAGEKRTSDPVRAHPVGA